MDKRGQWRITVEHGGQRREEYADVLLSGQGVLVHHKWPSISGLHDFKGHITHSANWTHDYDYSNKRVAVIGNGCTYSSQSSSSVTVAHVLAFPRYANNDHLV